MTAALVLARLPFARLVRTRRAILPVVGWTLFAITVTLVMRRAGSVSVDRALLTLFVPFVMPLVAYGIVSGALGGDSLTMATQTLSRFGASGKHAALATALVSCAASAIACALVGVLLVVAAHATSDAPLARDVGLTAYAGALAGVAHAAFFILGAAFGPRGGGRGVALLLNWLFGSMHGYASLLVPYAHARSLFGGVPAMALSEPASAWFSAGIAVACIALATVRVRR